MNIKFYSEQDLQQINDNLDNIEYTNDILNSIEILGVRVYIISFSKEFDTLENFKDTLKNPTRDLSLDGIYLYEYKTFISVESNDNLSDYTMFISCVHLNMLNL